MSDISSWYPAAASNTAAAPDGWPEGMSPADVNNCAREVMAATKRFVNARLFSLTDMSPSSFTSLASNKHGMCYDSAGKQFVVASQGGIWVGKSNCYWTKNSAVTGFRASAVNAAGNIFVAVGVNGSGDPIVYSSADAVTWTSRTSGLGAGITLYDVAWNPVLGAFVAVGSATGVTGSAIITSTDGTTWTVQTSHASFVNTLYAVDVDAAGLMAAAGADGIETSTDGVTWTSRSTATSFYSIKNNKGSTSAWVAGATGAIYTSANGTAWSNVYTEANGVYSVLYDAAGTWVCGVGSQAKGGYTLISTDSGATWSKVYPNYGVAQTGVAVGSTFYDMVQGGGVRLYMISNTLYAGAHYGAAS